MRSLAALTGGAVGTTSGWRDALPGPVYQSDAASERPDITLPRNASERHELQLL